MNERPDKGLVSKIYEKLMKLKMRKTKISFCFIGYSKDFDCVDNNKADNSTRDGNQFRSVQFSRSVVFDSLRPHEL